MKKFLVCFAIFTTLIFVASCGDSSKTSDTTDTGEDVTDEDTVDTDSQSDTEPTDDPTTDPTTEPTDDPTTDPTTEPVSDDDTSEIEPDDDDADLTPDDDTDPGDPESKIPECSPTSVTPCVDSKSTLMWSGKPTAKMQWEDALNYCEGIDEGGYTDWHLPTIGELRTLIQNCSNTETDGLCGVTDSCLSYSECRNGECSGCSSDPNGSYSKFGDTDWFWSSSVDENKATFAWYIYFINVYVNYNDKTTTSYVRCVR